MGNRTSLLIRGGAGAEYVIRKGTNNVFFTYTYFEQILERLCNGCYVIFLFNYVPCYIAAFIAAFMEKYQKILHIHNYYNGHNSRIPTP